MRVCEDVWKVGWMYGWLDGMAVTLSEKQPKQPADIAIFFINLLLNNTFINKYIYYTKTWGRNRTYKPRSRK